MCTHLHGAVARARNRMWKMVPDCYYILHEQRPVGRRGQRWAEMLLGAMEGCIEPEKSSGLDLGNRSSLAAFSLVFSPTKRKLMVNV